MPAGVYRLNEDDKNVIEENVPEEGAIPVPSTAEMQKLENWVHYQRSLLNCGRLTKFETEEEPAEEPSYPEDPV